MITLLDLLRRTEAWLAQRGVPQPRLDAERLIATVLGTNRLQLYLMYDRPMADEELDALRPLVKRRGEREPIGWLMSTVGFHDIELAVHPGVLVPRPDTEALVEAVRAAIGPVPGPGEADPDARCFLADVGCGSGAIGLALAAADPRVRVFAIDLSDAAIACTKDNVARLGLADRVAVLKGPMLLPVPEARPIDWVVSNPPYIPSDDLLQLEPEVRDHEPRLALDGGPDGLAVYRALVPAARARARAGLAVEIGHDQGPAVRALFEAAGFVDLKVLGDLAGRDRVVIGRIPNPSSGS